MHRIRLIFILWVAVLLVPACDRQEAEPAATSQPPAISTPAPTATTVPIGAPGEPYSSFAGGYAFRRITGWETEEFLGLASMQPPVASERYGPGFLLVGGLNDQPYTLDEAFANMTADFADQSFGNLNLAPLSETILAGAPAYTADIYGLEDGTPMAGRLIVALVNEHQTFFAFGFASQQEWDTEVGEVFANMLASIIFFDPVPLGGPLDANDQTAAATQTPPAEPAAPPDGFLWRLASGAGGDAGDGPLEFAAIDGLGMDSGGFLYAVGRSGGIQVLDPFGRLIERIEPDGFRDFDDVAVSEAGGGVIVSAAWGGSWIMVLDLSGQVLAQFGRAGDGPGEFGNGGSLAVALDRENRIYVLDSNVRDGLRSARMQVFDTAGNYLGAWGLDENLQARSIAYWAAPDPAEDRLYVLGGAGVWEYDLSGELLRAAIGEAVLEAGVPGELAVDSAGNFYVAQRAPGQVLKLDPNGNLVAEFGFDAPSGDSPWGAGGFHDPTAIAVSPDGNRVYVGDSGSFGGAYLTAFEYK